MTMKKVFIGFFLFCFFCGSFFLIALGQNSVWQYKRNIILESESISGMIPKGDQIRPSLLGFDLFAADMYWLKAVQYIGGNAREEKTALYDFLNLITDLDPRFEEAYHRGMLILPSDGKIDQAEELLQKGQKNIPNAKLLPYDGGFFYFFYEEDYEKSAEQYQKCVDTPGCNAAGSKRMLRNLEVRRGKYETAIQQWAEVLANEGTLNDDFELAKKKIKESLDLLLLNEALKLSPTDALSDLIGREVDIVLRIDGKENAIALAQYFLDMYGNNSAILESFITAKAISFSVSKQNLETPFPANPYELSEDKTKVRTKQF
jgi:hypothetical protein